MLISVSNCQYIELDYSWPLFSRSGHEYASVHPTRRLYRASIASCIAPHRAEGYIARKGVLSRY